MREELLFFALKGDVVLFKNFELIYFSVFHFLKYENQSIHFRRLAADDGVDPGVDLVGRLELDFGVSVVGNKLGFLTTTSFVSKVSLSVVFISLITS